MNKQRCAWAKEGTLDAEYHDTVWGVPQHDDRTLFEFLVLEASTGISDQISKDLKKRGMNFVGSTILYAFAIST